MVSTPAPAPIESFAPLLPPRPRVLVLGSMPSVQSLKQQAYYGHPRNRFWPLIAALFDGDAQAPYAQRVQHLLDQDIALWDVLARCIRPGSADAAIRSDSEIPNRIDRLLNEYPGISRVYFNGAAAQTCFQRHFSHLTTLNSQRLPSTSPANAAWSLNDLIRDWAPLRDSLRGA